MSSSQENPSFLAPTHSANRRSNLKQRSASQYGFNLSSRRIDPDAYGADYLSELARILDSHVTLPVRRILEWGSGITTQLLADYAERWSSELLLSLDENSAYQKAIFADRELPRCVRLKAVDLQGPGRSQRDPELNYATYPLSLGVQFDLIYIDGRRRMECALIAAILSHSGTTVIIHDYRRSRYQPILALFQIIDDGPQFRVLRIRPDIQRAMEPGIEAISGYMRCLITNRIPIGA